MLSVNTSLSSINTHRGLAKADHKVAISLEKLSSGHRINRAADDAAGLSIANSLLTQVNGTAEAQNNAQDGISLLNTTDGALGQVNDLLQQVRDLSVQSANGTYTAQDRQTLDNQAQQLLSEINDISANTSFNGITPLSSASTSVTLQVGADFGQTSSISINGTSTATLGLTGLSLTTQAGAQSGIGSIDAALSQVDATRGSVGAVTNQLSHTVTNLGVTNENSAAAESQIRDADLASEYTNLVSGQISLQAGLAMMGQANFKSQNLLGLL